MGINLTEVNYDNSFISCLLKEVEDKIALVSDKDYKNQVYNLGLNAQVYNYTNLLDMKNILSNMLKCNSCYECFEVEDVVSIAKNLINKC